MASREQLTAEQRAKRHWEVTKHWNERREERPFLCTFCRIADYKSVGWLRRHEKRCWRNPDAEIYLSGEYDPLLGPAGTIVGYIWNGRSEQERARIHGGMREAHEALGLTGTTVGPSHRKVVIGPDPTEQCARCPEARSRHNDLIGPCGFPGCPCLGFVGLDQ